MMFEPGDRVRVKGQPQREMTVKLVSERYILCEAWAGSGITIGGWPAEALEPVITVPIIRPLPAAPHL
jgi:hypothetical protein